ELLILWWSAGMAAHLSGGARPLSLRHGVRCEVSSEVSVEQVLMAVGESVGCENIMSASRMNKAVVVFVKDRELVHQLIEDGIRVGDGLSCPVRMERGTADFQMKNWEVVVGKVCAKLSQWTWVLPQLSYRGRVLVTNSLIASFLWHRFTVLEPPEPLIKEVQKRIVNFFWAGQHWTRAPVLYLPLQEGGQGLIDLSCRVRTFQLQAAQRLLYGEEIAWADTAYALLRRVEDLNYDKHLFVLNLREMDLSATTLFYQSVLRAWSSVLRISRINAQPFPCTEEEPLFHNPLIQSRMISSPYIQQHFQRAGITRVKDLRSGNSWKTARELCAETGVLSVRLMQRLLREVASALPSRFREALGQDPGRSHQPPPPLSISAAAGEYQWEKAALLSFQMSILTTLQDASKKFLIEVLWQV
ncbi:hypothetical protein QTP86_016565, partial [Hemibagrus guttatus]